METPRARARSWIGNDDGAPVEKNLAGVGLDDAVDGFDEGRLAGAVLAANHVYRALSAREAHIRERADAWIGLVDAAQLQTFGTPP